MRDRAILGNNGEIKRLEAQLEQERADNLKWEELEAKLCPEDFGFEEYIKSLQNKLYKADDLIKRLLCNVNSPSFWNETANEARKFRQFLSQARSNNGDG